MATWSKTITVQNHRELPYQFTCLYCGEENHGTLTHAASRSKEFKFTTSGAQEAGVEAAAKELELMDEINTELDNWESNLKLAASNFSELWKGCNNETASVPNAPKFVFSQFQCEHCKAEQPYSSQKKYDVKLKKPALILVSIGLLLAFFGIVFFFISIGRHPEDASKGVFRLLALCLGIPGIIMVVASFSLAKKADAATAKIQYSELQYIPYSPEKTLKFE